MQAQLIRDSAEGERAHGPFTIVENFFWRSTIASATRWMVARCSALRISQRASCSCWLSGAPSRGGRRKIIGADALDADARQHGS